MHIFLLNVNRLTRTLVLIRDRLQQRKKNYEAYLTGFATSSYIYGLTARDNAIVFMRYTYPVYTSNRYRSSTS